MRRIRSAMLAVLVLAGLALPGSASAQTQPITGRFTSTDVNVDPGVSAACGFTVTETDTTTGRFEEFFDNTATPIRLQVEENYTGFFSANGLTVDTAGANLARFHLINGGETDAGINIRVSLPGGGILYIDRGRLVFDGNGNLVFEAGSYPSIHGDIDGLCAALTP